MTIFVTFSCKVKLFGGLDITRVLFAEFQRSWCTLLDLLGVYRDILCVRSCIPCFL